MIELRLPWIEFAVLVPLLGAAWVARLTDPRRVRRLSLVVSAIALVSALGAYLDFVNLGAAVAHDKWNLIEHVFGSDLLVIDELSAPLLPLVALLFALTTLATMSVAVQRFSFASALVAESIVLCTLATRTPWLVTTLLVLGTLPPLIEQIRKSRSTRIYALYMGAFVALLVAGHWLGSISDPGSRLSIFAIALSTTALLVRCGIAPFHSWVGDQFEGGSFGTAILFTTPMIGVYGMMRLVLPFAPDWILSATAAVAVFTAVYAASMALVQRNARQFFGFLFIGNSALVLVGVDLATPVGLSGALCLWLSGSMALTGLGLTLRCVEARTGRLSLAHYHGLYEHIPMLALLFLLTGLASIGFPGTVGFVGAELLFEDSVGSSLWMGSLLVIAAALNGLAILNAYSRVFTGCSHQGTINLRIRPAERVAVLTLTLLILGGGVYPQPGITSRYHAAIGLLDARKDTVRSGPATTPIKTSALGPNSPLTTELDQAE